MALMNGSKRMFKDPLLIGHLQTNNWQSRDNALSTQ